MLQGVLDSINPRHVVVLDERRRHVERRGKTQVVKDRSRDAVVVLEAVVERERERVWRKGLAGRTVRRDVRHGKRVTGGGQLTGEVSKGRAIEVLAGVVAHAVDMAFRHAVKEEDCRFVRTEASDRGHAGTSIGATVRLAARAARRSNFSTQICLSTAGIYE